MGTLGRENYNSPPIHNLCVFVYLCNSLHRHISQADFMNIPNISQGQHLNFAPDAHILVLCKFYP